MVGRLADKPPRAGMPLSGLLVRQGLRDTLLHAEDLATFTKLRTGSIRQTQSLLLARPWMQVGGCPRSSVHHAAHRTRSSRRRAPLLADPGCSACALAPIQLSLMQQRRCAASCTALAAS